MVTGVCEVGDVCDLGEKLGCWKTQDKSRWNDDCSRYDAVSPAEWMESLGGVMLDGRERREEKMGMSLRVGDEL
jgi:hypothetical protein